MADPLDVREIDFDGPLGMLSANDDEIFRLVATGKPDPAAVVSGTIGLEEVSATLDAMNDYETVGIPVVDEFWIGYGHFKLRNAINLT